METRLSARQALLGRLGLCCLSLLVCSKVAFAFQVETAEPPVAEAPVLSEILEKEAPEDLADLLALEEQVLKHRDRMLQATVCVTVGNAQGSGVVVSEDGYVMTAAHVIGRPGLQARIIFADGSIVPAETLGVDEESDAGMLRIVKPGKWAFCELAESQVADAGDWCLAVGHPGGYRRGRPPVFRIGRVISTKKTMVQTDCTLVGGDSGGPLFDLEGQVIGINSRIGASTAWNFHVPVAVYHKDWETLSSPAGFLGVGGDPSDLSACLLTTVKPGGPSAEAGLREGDILKKFDGKTIKNFVQLVETVAYYRPDQVVEVEVERGGETLTFEVTLTRKDPYGIR